MTSLSQDNACVRLPPSHTFAGTDVPVSAQAPYPNRNITLVLPFAAGSGTDTTTRLIFKGSRHLRSASALIENKVGRQWLR